MVAILKSYIDTGPNFSFGASLKIKFIESTDLHIPFKAMGSQFQFLK